MSLISLMLYVINIFFVGLSFFLLLFIGFCVHKFIENKEHLDRQVAVVSIVISVIILVLIKLACDGLV